MGRRNLYHPRMYALVDCNNFFVSCERVFNPRLRKRPVAVLSNNDGCVIARSNEVKQLGIPMGAPIFKYRHLIKKHQIITLSSNFALYGDMSNRVMHTLESFGYPIEFYSIDEAFLEVPTSRIENIYQKVKQWTGIPTSIGIAPTKTLAKVANKIAKNRGLPTYIFNPTDLKTFPIKDVWGFGRRYSAFLEERGITTVHRFLQKKQPWVKKHLSINGLRTYLELQGTPCITLEEQAFSRKSLVRSRSFKHEITSYTQVREAIASFITYAAEKLRIENLIASHLTVFIKSKCSGYHSSYFQLPQATAYTPLLLQYALILLEKIFRKGMSYKKGGVMLSELTDANSMQPDLFEKNASKKESQLMNTMDAINTKYNKQMIHSAALGASWKTEPINRTPHFTTQWDEIPVIQIDRD